MKLDIVPGSTDVRLVFICGEAIRVSDLHWQEIVHFVRHMPTEGMSN